MIDKLIEDISLIFIENIFYGYHHHVTTYRLFFIISYISINHESNVKDLKIYFQILFLD